MDAQEVVDYVYNEILLSHKKKMNACHLHNIDGPGGYYVKWKKSDKRETNIILIYSYVKYKNQQ